MSIPGTECLCRIRIITVMSYQLQTQLRQPTAFLYLTNLGKITHLAAPKRVVSWNNQARRHVH
jgi:hypothetical protein